MNNKWTLLKWLGVGCVLTHLLARDAYAYLDPGTGSYVLQIVMAFFVAAVFAAKTYWAVIKDFVVRLFSSRNANGDRHK